MLQHLFLSSTPQSQHQMDRRLLLDIKICESSAILELLARKDKALLVWGNALLILDLLLNTLHDKGRGRCHIVSEHTSRSSTEL